jgi:hypothetical protein
VTIVSDVLRVGNCSGFYGDRFGAMRQMLTGGDLDVLTVQSRREGFRSGDKGGDANVGIWIGADHARRDDAYAWLANLLTPDRIRLVLPEAKDLDVEVHRLPNLRAVNVVIRGLLGEGVAASTRLDPQAKALGEWLRARHVDIPEDLL